MDESNRQSLPDWRSTARGFIEKLKYILVNSILADLTIRLVNEGEIIKEYKVHSFLFIIGSEIFEKMLNSTFKEGVTRVIEIKDVDPEILQILINYLYGQPLNLKKIENLKIVQDVIDIADYYMIHGLKDEIAKHYKSLDTPGSACWGLVVAEKCNDLKLKDSKLQYIVNHTEEVVQQKEFLSLLVENISWILEQGTLAIKEVELFKAIEMWIKLNVDKYGKQMIDSLISKVRYLNMTREEFILGPAKSSWIKPEDRVALLCNLNLKDSMPFPSGFSQIKRKCYKSYELNFERTELNVLNCKNQRARDQSNIPMRRPTDQYWGGMRRPTNQSYQPITNYQRYKETIKIQITKDTIIEGFHIFTLNGNQTQTYAEDIQITVEGTVGDFKGKVNYSSSVFVQLERELKIVYGKSYIISVEFSSGSRKAISLDSKPLDVRDFKLSFVALAQDSDFVSPIQSIKFKLFE